MARDWKLFWLCAGTARSCRRSRAVRRSLDVKIPLGRGPPHGVALNRPAHIVAVNSGRWKEGKRRACAPPSGARTTNSAHRGGAALASLYAGARAGQRHRALAARAAARLRRIRRNTRLDRHRRRGTHCAGGSGGHHRDRSGAHQHRAHTAAHRAGRSRLAAVHRGPDCSTTALAAWPTNSGSRCTKVTSSTPRSGCSAAPNRRIWLQHHLYDAAHVIGTTPLCTLVYTSHFLATPSLPRCCGCATARTGCVSSPG